jgi:hypothetical protein
MSDLVPFVEEDETTKDPRSGWPGRAEATYAAHS